MRDLSKVLEQMIEVIPPWEELVLVLKDNLVQGLSRSEVSYTLEYYLGQHAPTEGWQKKVYDIWMDKNND